MEIKVKLDYQIKKLKIDHKQIVKVKPNQIKKFNLISLFKNFKIRIMWSNIINKLKTSPIKLNQR